MNIKKLLSSLALAVTGLAAATGASADEILRGTLDGEQRQWHVLVAHGQSTTYFQDETGYLDVTIQGHAEPRFATKGALSISMLAMGGQPPDEADVMYFPEAGMLPNYNSDGQHGELELARFTIDGDELRVTGRYRGTLGYVETIGPRAAPTRVMEVDVEFDLIVPRGD